MVPEQQDGQEKILLTTKPSRLYFAKIYGLFVFFLALGVLSFLFGPQAASQYEMEIQLPRLAYLAPLLISPIFLIWAELARIGHRYSLTDQKVIKEEGIFSKAFKSVRYDQITDTTLEMNFTERMFSLGDIAISTAGTTGYEVVLKGLNDPREIKSMIEQQMEQGIKLSEESIQELAEKIGGGSREINEINELRQELREIEENKRELRERFDNYELEERQFDQRMQELDREESEIRDKLEKLEEELRRDIGI